MSDLKLLERFPILPSCFWGEHLSTLPGLSGLREACLEATLKRPSNDNGQRHFTGCHVNLRISSRISIYIYITIITIYIITITPIEVFVIILYASISH